MRSKQTRRRGNEEQAPPFILLPPSVQSFLHIERRPYSAGVRRNMLPLQLLPFFSNSCTEWWNAQSQSCTRLLFFFYFFFLCVCLSHSLSFNSGVVLQRNTVSRSLEACFSKRLAVCSHTCVSGWLSSNFWSFINGFEKHERKEKERKEKKKPRTHNEIETLCAHTFKG